MGRYNHFFKNASYAPGVNATANGSIYFTPSSGTYEVHGPVRDKWASLGYEASCLGYPTSDVLITSTDQESNFNGGTVIYNNASAQTVSNCNAPGTNQDYMPPGATINPQCNQPVSERVGNWWCPTAGGSAPTQAHATPALTTPTGGFCNSSGCYHQYDDFKVDFESSNGSWGYGPTTLGVESHSITWQLTGAESRAQPVSYFNSVPTTDVIFSGDLFNAAPGVEGDPVGGANGVNVVGNVDAFTPTRWNPNGFKSYDNTAYDHSQVIQISWKYPGYDGYWYTYTKSPSSHDSAKTTYRFDGVDQLPSMPFGGGYRN